MQERYEQYRAAMTDARLVDRRHAQLALFREAEKAYESNTGETVAHWQRRLLARYTRNLALAAHGLVAGLFDLTVAARGDRRRQLRVGGVGHAGRYSHQKVQSDAPTVKISGEEVWLDTKKLRLRRRLPSQKRRLRPVGLRPRKKEKFPGEWATQLDGNSICSYPPEDLVIEDYGRFLKKKGKSILSEERVRTEPFTTSVLDGMDMRETIRNWYEKRIYVRQYQKVSGEVGSVVVVFDEDRENRYPYMTTWLGEHQNESDMAFYSTFPFDNMVGPGIGRGEYGGFLMSLPARRMFDVWRDPDYDFGRKQGRATASGGPGLFLGTVCGLCSGQAAALGLPQSGRPFGPHDHLCPYRAAFAGGAEKDSGSARARRLRQTPDRQRVHLVILSASASSGATAPR